MTKFNEKQKASIVNKAFQFGLLVPTPFVKDIESKISSLHKTSKEEKKEYWDTFQSGFSLAIQERKLEREKRLAQIQDKETDRSRNR